MMNSKSESTMVLTEPSASSSSRVELMRASCVTIEVL